MKEVLRKILVLSLVVFLVAPNLAWSVEFSSDGAGLPAENSAIINAGLTSDAVQPVSGVDFSQTQIEGVEGLETQFPEQAVEGTEGQEALRAAQVRPGAAALRAAGQFIEVNIGDKTAQYSVPTRAVVQSLAAGQGSGATVVPVAGPAQAVRPTALSIARGMARMGLSIIGTPLELSQSPDGSGKFLHAYAALEDVYDVGLAASSNGSEISEGGDSAEEGLSEESQKIHKDWEDTAKRKSQAFNEKVSRFKAGIFGAGMALRQSSSGVGYDVIATVNGAPVSNNAAIEKMIASGAIPESEKANWEIAKATIQGFKMGLKALLDSNEQAHQAAHQQMERIERALAMRKYKERQAIGKDLENWGVANKISVDPGEPAGLRYSNLYRLNGLPTDLGAALHKILAPMVAEDPAILSRITQGQIHEAVKLLAQGLSYVLDPSSEDFQKLRRMGLMSEAYSYPEWRDSFEKKAKEALLATPEEGDLPYGLGLRSGKKSTTEVLDGIMDDVARQYKVAASQGASDEQIAKFEGLLLSLSATTGSPVDMGKGPVPVVVRHAQLLPVLAELQKRQAEESVVKAAIRAFPLGESIYRLGIHLLWAMGFTGKGIKVAVLDSGSDFDHPDFTGAKTLSENLTRDRGWHTKGGHGTAMADIIRALAPDAEIQSYQVLSNSPLPGVRLSDSETYAAVLKGMDRARANGAQIISMSLGFPMGLANDALAKKIAEFAKEGIMVVVSAGNEGFDLPAGSQLRTPGTALDAITVEAVDYHGKKAYFSSTGYSMNPDNYSLQDKNDIAVFGVNIKAATRLPSEAYSQEAVPYIDVSGTSPAAPHIAALAALMLQAAHDRGLQTNTAGTVNAAKQALRGAAKMINHLPVLQSAKKAVDGFVRILSANPQR